MRGTYSILRLEVSTVVKVAVYVEGNKEVCYGGRHRKSVMTKEKENGADGAVENLGREKVRYSSTRGRRGNKLPFTWDTGRPICLLD